MIKTNAERYAARDAELINAMQTLEQELAPIDVPVWSINSDSGAWDAVRLALKSHELFSKGRQAYAGNHQLQLDPEMMLNNIGRSLKTRGVLGTLNWFYRVHRLEKFRSRQCGVMVGATVAKTVTFSNGVQLLPVEDMRSSWNVDQVKAVYRGPRYIIEHRPWNVVGMVRIVEKEFSPHTKNFKEDYKEFHDIALAATIASESGAPVVELSWSEYDDQDFDDTEIGRGHMPGRYEGRTPLFEHVDIGDSELEWIERYLALKGTTKAAIKTAASRLNMARRRFEDGNKAIDLSTAFEAVLSRPGEQGEMTYKFRLRAALLLADTYKERIEVSKQMAELYRVRGKIVHGDIENAPNSRAISDWGTRVCGQLLRKIMLKGRLADFTRLELTGIADEAFL